MSWQVGDRVKARIPSAESGRVAYIVVDATVVQPASKSWINSHCGKVVLLDLKMPDGQIIRREVPGAHIIAAVQRSTLQSRPAGDAVTASMPTPTCARPRASLAASPVPSCLA